MRSTYTIGKSIKHYEEPRWEWIIWWTWSRDITCQRVSGKAKWRNPPWAILRPPPADLEESASHHFSFILSTLIFHDFHNFENVCQYFWWSRCRTEKPFLPSEKHQNYEEQRWEWIIWWTWSRDITEQRVPGNTKWRNLPWAILRPPPADLEESASHHFWKAFGIIPMHQKSFNYIRNTF